MSTVKTIKGPDGRDYKAIEEDFKIVGEAWNEYHLQDGTVVKLRTTASKILRVVDDSGKPLMNPQGDPFIIVQNNTVVSVSG